MKTRFSRILPLGLIIVLVLWTSPARGQEAKQPSGTNGQGPTRPKVAPKVVAAWEKSGFQYGWYQRKAFFATFWRDRDLEEPEKEGKLPAFHYRRIDPGIPTFRDLPAPDCPFVLSLQGTCLNRSRLKELAGFKNLEVLLGVADVTDAQMAGFQPSQSVKMAF